MGSLGQFRVGGSGKGLWRSRWKARVFLRFIVGEDLHMAPKPRTLSSTDILHGFESAKF